MNLKNYLKRNATTEKINVWEDYLCGCEEVLGLRLVFFWINAPETEFGWVPISFHLKKKLFKFPKVLGGASYTP